MSTSQPTEADLRGFCLAVADLVNHHDPSATWIHDVYDGTNQRRSCSHGPGNGPSGHSYKAFDTFVATNGDGWQLISPAHSLMFCPNCGGDVYTNRCGCGFYVNRKGR